MPLIADQLYSLKLADCFEILSTVHAHVCGYLPNVLVSHNGAIYADVSPPSVYIHNTFYCWCLKATFIVSSAPGKSLIVR